MSYYNDQTLTHNHRAIDALVRAERKAGRKVTRSKQSALHCFSFESGVHISFWSYGRGRKLVLNVAYDPCRNAHLDRAMYRFGELGSLTGDDAANQQHAACFLLGRIASFNKALLAVGLRRYDKGAEAICALYPDC